MMIDDSKINKGFWITNLVIVTFFWGLTFVFIKDALNDISVQMFLVIRFSTAMFLMVLSIIIIAAFSERSDLITKLRKSLKCFFFSKGWLLGIILYGAFFFQTYGIDLSTPANVAFITGVNVVFVPILSYFLGNRLRFASIVSMILGIVGLALLILDFNNLTINFGDTLVLVTAVLVAIHIIGTDHYVKYEPVKYIVLSQFVSMSLISTAVALIIEPRNFFATITAINQNMTVSVINALVLTVVFATIYAFAVQTYAQKREVSPLVIALIFALEPVFALIASVFLGEEQLNIMKLSGMTIIFIAIILTVTKGTNDSKNETMIETS